MSGYVSAIVSACLVFIMISVLITIPYIIYVYHKYGTIFSFRVFIIYSFILYLLAAYFLTILPLPTLEEVQKMTGDMIQLIPFRFLFEIATHVKLDLSIFKAREIYQVFFNFLLTVPFGFYLNYYFKKDLKKTIIYSFLLSLFFELTQLTGLYFIYPRAYRLFDVDDLMLNTLGGLAGWHLTSLFKFLPTRDELDKKDLEKGTRVSWLKRFTAYALDTIILSIITGIINFCFKDISFILCTIIGLIIVFMIIPIISKGYTFGKKIVNIKIVKLNDEDCIWYQYIIRYGFLYLIVLGIPELLSFIYQNLKLFVDQKILIGLAFVYFLIVCLVFVYIFINNICRKKPLLYEKISKTKVISTIKVLNNKE